MPTSGATQKMTLEPVSSPLRIAGLVIVCLASFAQIGRALLILDGRAWWVWYVLLGAVYLALFTLVILLPPRRRWLAHVAMAAECLLVLELLSLEPELDFMTALFVPLAFLAVFFFAGRIVWIWVAGLAALTAGSLMVFLGPLRGLALALVSMAVEVVVAAFVVVAREIDTAQGQSQAMLQELQTTHQQLQDYAAQAGELATLDERDRVARDLNDSVAQTVSDILNATRAARSALAAADEAGPQSATTGNDEAAPRLAALQVQTQRALAQMRGLIAQLRPSAELRPSTELRPKAE